MIDGENEMSKKTCDVLIAGGGTCGLTAAIAAAQEGSQVIIVESDSVIGGMGIRGGVCGYWLGMEGGIQDIINSDAAELKEIFGDSDSAGIHSFHTEAKKSAISSIVDSLNIEIICCAVVADVIMEGNRITGVIVETEYNRIDIAANIIIDATTDGNVAYLAGQTYTIGRDWDGVTMTYTVPAPYVTDECKLTYFNNDPGWVDPENPQDIYRAYIEGRSHVWDFKDKSGISHLTRFGSQLGTREGRHICCKYTLTEEDIIDSRWFNDIVMQAYSHFDNHNRDYANESDFTQLMVYVFNRESRRTPFICNVPFRCFIAKDIEGLLIGGRAFSMTHDAATFLRMQLDIQKVGEVLGVAAALSVKQGIVPENLNITELQGRLIERGVISEADLKRKDNLDVNIVADEDFKLEIIDNSDKSVDELCKMFGTDSEKEAIWTLWRRGADIENSIVDFYNSCLSEQKKGAAFLLALFGNKAGVPTLIDTLKQKEIGSEEWISAVVLLKILKDKAGIKYLIKSLEKVDSTKDILFVLHYFIRVATYLTDDEIIQVKRSMKNLLSRKKLGEDYKQRLGARTSMRWNIELAVGFLYELLGFSGKDLIVKYLDSNYGYVRKASVIILSRLNEEVKL